MTQNLIDTLERDIRNQVLIDQMKKLSRKGKLMVLAMRVDYWKLAGRIAMLLSAAFMIVLLSAAWALLFADEPVRPQCPDPGIRCKVIFLTEQEQQMLMTQNGILDTAAQGRALELGQFSVYLKTKIAGAPQGEVKQPPAPPAPPQGQINPAEQKPVDKPQN